MVEVTQAETMRKSKSAVVRRQSSPSLDTHSLDGISIWRSMSDREASQSRVLSDISKDVVALPEHVHDNEQPQLPKPLHSSCSSDILSKTLQDILSPERIAALEACDVNAIQYNPHSFFSYIFTFRGRNFSMTVYPLLALLLWGLGWQLLFIFIEKGENYNEQINAHVSDLQHLLASIDSLISQLITPVSFLLTFRLGRAAIRFWDARQAAGKMTEICRANIATVTVNFISPLRLKRRHDSRRQQTYRDEDVRQTTTGIIDKTQIETQEKNAQLVNKFDIEDEIKLLCEYARWLTSFPVAVKHFLRPEERQGWENIAYYKKRRFEIGPLLSDEDANNVILVHEDDNGKAVFDKNAKRVRDPPLVVLNRLHELSYNIAFHSYSDEACNPSTQQRSILFQQLNNQVNILYGSYGTMERIKNTPLPFVYVIHLRTFLLLYLFLWNMTSVASSGWIALPALFAFNWSLLGIEAASVECELPFDWKANHLTLGKICVVIANNVAQALKEVRY